MTIQKQMRLKKSKKKVNRGITVERYINKWKQLLNNVKEKIENDKIEEQELSGNIVKNSTSRIILAEVCDISRIRFDYGIRLKNDNLVRTSGERSLVKKLNLRNDFYTKASVPLVCIGRTEGEIIYEIRICSNYWKTKCR